jgi:hypothetical protein
MVAPKDTSSTCPSTLCDARAKARSPRAASTDVFTPFVGSKVGEGGVGEGSRFGADGRGEGWFSEGIAGATEGLGAGQWNHRNKDMFLGNDLTHFSSFTSLTGSSSCCNAAGVSFFFFSLALLFVLSVAPVWEQFQLTGLGKGQQHGSPGCSTVVSFEWNVRPANSAVAVMDTREELQHRGLVHSAEDPRDGGTCQV